jgi:chromatin assembly factor 1 subunit B
MIAKTLEINWHDGQAIYSIDFSLDSLRYATAGADCSIRVRPRKEIQYIRNIYPVRFGAFKNDLIMQLMSK